MLLAEDLLLLLTDDRTGGLLVTAGEVDAALAGALLMDLALPGRVDVDERKRLVVRDGSPTGDELLDRALGAVSQKQGKKPSAVLGPLGKNLRERLYARLTGCGILRAQHDKVLGIFPRHRWPTASADHESAVRRALTAALVTGTTPDPRDAALVALLHALRATDKVVDPKEHGLRRRDLDRRAKQVAEGSWASEAVRQAVDEMAAAVMVAVSAATVATTASG
ncbi:MAG: hypothetical protein QOF53_2244 [Nocardioidaceae bacterium]|jgi:hypothetical protein|nr:hypothetical protein [Nocardioidaceae bacterium]